MPKHIIVLGRSSCTLPHLEIGERHRPLKPRWSMVDRQLTTTLRGQSSFTILGQHLLLQHLQHPKPVQRVAGALDGAVLRKGDVAAHRPLHPKGLQPLWWYVRLQLRSIFNARRYGVDKEC